MKVDIRKTKDNLIEWIKEWFNKNGNDQTVAVLGISGGKDSTICAALLKEALGPERVVGVLMPNNVQSDIADSKALVEFLGIKSMIVNIGQTYESITKEINDSFSKTDLKYEQTPQYKTNTPARLRMVTLYGVGAMLGNSRVCNTGNLSEAMIGYTTLYGDFAGDFALISKLTKSEVVKIGDALGLPRYLVHKAPGDGMSGKTDEDNIGFTYDELDDLIRNGTKGPNYEIIDKRIKSMEFKRKMLTIPFFDKIVEE